jgi:hypothetical protein
MERSKSTKKEDVRNLMGMIFYTRISLYELPPISSNLFCWKWNRQKSKTLLKEKEEFLC